VTRQATALPVKPIREAIQRAIVQQMPWPPDDVTISAIRFDENIQMPTGDLTYRIVPNRGEDFLGKTILNLHLYVDGQPVRKVWAHANISVMADVVTLVRPLGKHQHVEMADLALKRRDLAGLPSDAIRRIEDAVGNRALRMIYPDTVLRTSMISMPPVVNRGDVVKIVASSGVMTITATGLVKEQGRKGDLVRVVNTDSKRIVTARVAGPGTVEVDF
jgi:flagella basal body P-ring formation protein FlgA